MPSPALEQLRRPHYPPPSRSSSGSEIIRLPARPASQIFDPSPSPLPTPGTPRMYTETAFVKNGARFKPDSPTLRMKYVPNPPKTPRCYTNIG